MKGQTKDWRIVFIYSYSLFLILFILFSSFLPYTQAMDQDPQDMVHLGLVGEWNGYGQFNAVKIWKSQIAGSNHGSLVNYAYCTTSKGLVIINIETRSVSAYIPLGECQDLAIENLDNEALYIYIAGGKAGLFIYTINIDNPKVPYFMAQYDTPGTADGVDIEGDYAYVADGEFGLQIIDISKRSRPCIAGNYDTPGKAMGVAIDIVDKYAYVADEKRGLQIIDISDKSRPYIAGNCDTPGKAMGVAIDIVDKYAYVADGEFGLQIINISEPRELSIDGNCNTPGNAQSVAIDDTYAYVADGESGLRIIDISDKSSPHIIGNCGTPGFAFGVAIDGEYAYVADGSGGLQIINISNPDGPHKIGYYYIPGGGKSVTVYGEYAYVADWGHGLQIIDIGDPNDPNKAGDCKTPVGAEDIAVDGNYAYLVVRNDGLKVIDISNPRDPNIVGECSIPGKALSVTVDGNYAYVAGNSGLQKIDISYPNNPNVVSTYNKIPTDAFDVAVDGNYAYIAGFNNSLYIINISDPNDPNFPAYCSTGWISDMAIDKDTRYAYVTNIKNSIKIIDISKPMAPEVVKNYILPGGQDLVGVDIKGEHVYVVYNSNRDPNNGGLYIIDISDPRDPNIIAECDISGKVRCVDTDSGYAYIVGSGLHILDIRNPRGPNIIETIGRPVDVRNVTIDTENGFGYVVDDRINGLQIFDIRSPNGLNIVGTCKTSDIAKDVAIKGNYAYVVTYLYSTLQIIDISKKNNPNVVGTCKIPSGASGVATYGDYAYIVDLTSGLQIMDVKNPQDPNIIVTYEIPGGASDVAIDGNYAYVIGKECGLEIVDIRNPRDPNITGKCITPGFTEGVAIHIEGGYAYVACGEFGLQIIDIRNPRDPNIIGECEIPYPALDVAIDIKTCYAYVACGEFGLQIIDISNPRDPIIVGRDTTIKYAQSVTIDTEGGHVYVAGSNEMLKLKTNIGLSSKGNLILVTGGSGDYKDPYWQATQSLSNHVFNTFVNNSYEVYDIYYFNPSPIQDIDKDSIPNQMVVDDPIPTTAELWDKITQWAPDQIDNTGPLYIYLIGHGAEDRFQMMPNEVIRAQELKDSINQFQEITNRQVVIIIESAASGTFIDDLLDDNITVITSTDEEASYIKPVFSDPNIPYISFTTAFIKSYSPNLFPMSTNDLDVVNAELRDSFISARAQLQNWTLYGHPFADQAPQMWLPGNTLTSLNFYDSSKGHMRQLSIDQTGPCDLTIIGWDINNTIPLFVLQNMTFFSSDPNILDPNNPEDVTMIDLNGIPWYRIYPRKNGIFTLIGYADPETDPNLLLSAKLTIEVSDPNYPSGKGKIAVIMAGYKGTGDYLWESTNTIANHAYLTLRAMGYTKDEIYYYNPYFLQDLEGEGEYDEIYGYPRLDALNPDLPYSAFNKISQTGATECVLFFVDHGNKDIFCVNPTEELTSGQLIDRIIQIAKHIDEKIIFLYDACHSGSFLSAIEQEPATDALLANKLVTIASTDPNQTAYFLNQGLVSFSYPFLDEWLLTHSLIDAFDYAKQSLPLKGQTPCRTDPNFIRLWDQDRIYYVDESRPIIDEVQASRKGGKLHINAQVYSLTGISKVWAIVESAQNTLTNSTGKAATEAPELYFSTDPDDIYSDPNLYGGKYILTTFDPCPNETNYIIHIYAIDKSKRQKTASYKTAIGNITQNKTMALIISDPDLIEDPEIRQKIEAQINRAIEVLKWKGLDEDSIIRIRESSELESTSIPKGRILFIYLIGEGGIKDKGPYFSLNPNDITPSTLSNLPYDPNQQLLILMDSPYAWEFLDDMNQTTLPKNWAGIASTNRDGLFFDIQGDPFPCFSYFFFSMILSGATVSQAYRMAENAVSITQQNPDLLPPEKFQDFQTINRHLNYYLGTSAIHGESYSLFTECKAEIVEDMNGKRDFHLRITPRPEVDIFNPRVVLTTPHISNFESSMIVDLLEDSYLEVIPYSPEYHKAYFMVEGRPKGETNNNKSWIDWKEVPIIHPDTGIGEDIYEPDDDPNMVLFFPGHEIIVNDILPMLRTFYDEEPHSEECRDIDWMYFYALKDHTYEIYAQDLSEYGYFIQLSFYDENIEILSDPNSGLHITDNNFLTFICRESGYYLLELRLASSYPPGGIKYILSVSDPQAGSHSACVFGRIVKEINKIKEGVNGIKVFMEPIDYSFESNDDSSKQPRDDLSGSLRNVDPNFDQSMIDGWFFINGLYAPYSYKINIIDPTTSLSDPNTTITLKLHEFEVRRIPDITIYQELSQSDPNEMKTIGFYTLYDRWKLALEISESFEHWEDNDNDDYSNGKEFLNGTDPLDPNHPTFKFVLNQGLNLFPFWKSDLISASEFGNSYLKDHDYSIWKYNRQSQGWDNFYSDSMGKDFKLEKGKVYIIYVDTKPDKDIFQEIPTYLSSLIPGINLIHITNTESYNKSFQLLEDRESEGVKSINRYNNNQEGHNKTNGRWETTYWFFGRPSGIEFPILPDVAYLIYVGSD